MPVLYRGIYDENFLRNYKIDTTKQEGYVIRLASSFQYEDFATSVAKWVREDHVTTDEHWLDKPVVPNKLAI